MMWKIVMFAVAVLVFVSPVLAAADNAFDVAKGESTKDSAPSASQGVIYSLMLGVSVLVFGGYLYFMRGKSSDIPQKQEIMEMGLSKTPREFPELYSDGVLNYYLDNEEYIKYLQQKYTTPNEPQIKKLAADLTKNAKSDEEKLENITFFVFKWANYIKNKNNFVFGFLMDVPVLHELGLLVAKQIHGDIIEYTEDRTNIGPYSFLSDEPQYPMETLKRGKGDCEDMAFLWISLAAAAGFEVRVNGGGTTVNGIKYAHAWPEVKIGKEWMPVDPLSDVWPDFREAVTNPTKTINQHKAIFSERFLD